MGSDASDDVLVYEEMDETFGTSVYKSKSKKYMVIACYSTLTTEFRFLSADDPEGEFQSDSRPGCADWNTTFPIMEIISILSPTWMLPISGL